MKRYSLTCRPVSVACLSLYDEEEEWSHRVGWSSSPHPNRTERRRGPAPRAVLDHVRPRVRDAREAAEVGRRLVAMMRTRWYAAPWVVRDEASSLHNTHVIASPCLVAAPRRSHRMVVTLRGSETRHHQPYATHVIASRSSSRRPTSSMRPTSTPRSSWSTVSYRFIPFRTVSCVDLPRR